MSLDFFRFPSSRSVGNCRNDAKRLAADKGIALTTALDQVALLNGGSVNWAVSMRESIQPPPLIVVPAQTVEADLMTADDIRAVLTEHPITEWGYGVPREEVKSEGSYKAALAARQAHLATAVDHCNKAVRFLRHVEQRKTINARVGTSYGLKHQVERFTRRLVNAPRDGYLTNGSFICAALHRGFTMKTYLDSPNPTFNISSKSPMFEWQDLELHRPTTRAQYERLDVLTEQLGIKPEHKNPWTGLDDRMRVSSMRRT